MADTFTHGTPDCGGRDVVGSVDFDAATGDGSFDCRFADDDPTGTASDDTSVSTTVTDDDTGSGTGSKDVTVSNVDPTVVVTGEGSVPEGQTRTYPFDTTDAGSEDAFTAGVPDCGTGTLVVGSLIYSPATGDGSFDCEFADDDPTGTASDATSASISVTDDDTGSDSDSKSVTVTNVDPTVVVSGDGSVSESQTLRTYSFDTTDPGVPDTFTHRHPVLRDRAPWWVR